MEPILTSNSAVLRTSVLASWHDHHTIQRMIIARARSTACHDRADDTSQEVAVRLHFATARQPFALAVLHRATWYFVEDRLERRETVGWVLSCPLTRRGYGGYCYALFA